MHRPLAAIALSLVAAALVAGGAFAVAGVDGAAPPEVAANAATGWPEHNYDLSNTRATTSTDINAANVATLKKKWTFKLPYTGQFGAFTSNPIVLDGVVYIQDPDSNIYALNQDTGKVIWSRKYNDPTPSGGPNGVAVGYGMVFGATSHAEFALSLETGKQVWAHKLTRNSKEGIDMAPQLYDGKVSCRPFRATRRRSTRATRTASCTRLTPRPARRSGSSRRSTAVTSSGATRS